MHVNLIAQREQAEHICMCINVSAVAYFIKSFNFANHNILAVLFNYNDCKAKTRGCGCW